MELHFCSQCGVSIPLVEVESGRAKAGPDRYLCNEHRPTRALELAGVAAAAAGASRPDTPSAGLVAGGARDLLLLFCANCQVSIPVDDERSGRAAREFGSLFCTACSKASVPERERRKRVVEAALSNDGLPDVPSRPSPVAGAADVRPESAARAPSAAPTGSVGSVGNGGGGGTAVLVTLLVLAFGAAGFFGAEYVRARQKSAPGPTATETSQTLRNATEQRIKEWSDEALLREERLRESHEKTLDDLRLRFADDLGAIRNDLANLRTDYSSADGGLGQRIAKVEGQIGPLQDLVRGLAVRPPEVRPDPRNDGAGAGNGGGAPPPPAPPPPPDADPQAPSAEVSRHVKTLLESRDNTERFAAAIELTRLAHRAAIPAFAKACIEDEDVMVRRAAAGGLGELKAWHAIPVLVQVLEDRQPYVAHRANSALFRLTGQDFGVTTDLAARDRKNRAATALKWWEKNKGSPPADMCLEPVSVPAPK